MARPLSLALFALFACALAACGSDEDASPIGSDPFRKPGEAIAAAELARLREAGGKNNMEKLLSGTPAERERAAREMAADMRGMGIAVGQDGAQAKAVAEALAKSLGSNEPLTDESVAKFFDYYAKMKAAPTNAEKAKVTLSDAKWNTQSVMRIKMKFGALKAIDANPEAAQYMPPYMLPTEAEKAILRRYMARWEELESR